MKTSLHIAFLTLALVIAIPAWADPLQNGSPGAQGTEGTNPTHEDASVTGPNGQHVTNTNPANEPTPAPKKKHHKKPSTATTTNSASAM